LLGLPTWRLGGAASSLKRIDAALLAYLAIRGVQERDALALLFWPTADLAVATTNLRKRVSRLRQETRHDLFATGSSISLLEAVSVDVHDRLADLAPETLLARGELLAGANFADLGRFNQWLVHEREGWRRRLADALSDKATQMERDGDWAAALKLGERIVDLVPVLETAWCRQMRLHYLSGDQAAAVDAFERFEQIVTRQLGTRPSKETIELLATIERAGAEPPARRVSLPTSLVRPPVLVGREPQWLAMARAWAGGRPFLLRGDAGMGKSRLLADFLRGTAGVVAADGRPGDELSTYAVLTRLLRAALRAYPVAPDGFTRHELSRILVEFGPPPEGSAGQQAALWQAIENLLLAAAHAGLGALVVDDLHFADAASIEALRWLSASRALADVRFGFVTRNEQSVAVRALMDEWLVDSQRPEAIDLPLLSRTDIERLIESLGLPELDSAALGETLFVHAGGQPFLSLETMKDMVLYGAALDSGPLPRPSTVQPLLERRLRGVPEGQAELVHVAAVMGGELTVPRAAAVLRRSLPDTQAGFVVLESCQVFNGRGFAHDLLRECALQQIPPARRKTMHVGVAEALSGDDGVPPARLAFHWEAAKRWPEAAACLRAAAVAARVAGRLQEQRTLLERAAQCWQRAGNPGAEFDALRAGTESVLVRQGPGAVLDELPRLQALAVTPERELSVLIVRAEALAHLFRSEESLDASTQAVHRAEQHPDQLVDALIVHGMALAQCGRHEEASQAHRRAVSTAEQRGSAAQVLQLTHMLVVMLFQAGRLGEAIVAARESARLTRASGDHVEAAQVEGNLTTLLMMAGDPAGANEVAQRVRRQHQVMGSSADSVMGGMNLLHLGNAARFLGRFDEALDCLQAAARTLGNDGAARPRFLAGVSLANLWLTLGATREARAAMPPLMDGLPPANQMQWHWTRARIDAMEGNLSSQHLRRLGEIQAANPDLPIGQSAWVEWSHQGEAAAVIAQLRQVRRDCERMGLPGLARSLMVREIDRLAEIDGRDAIESAARLATELETGIGLEMHVTTYLPEAWLILARAWDRAGEHGQAAKARGEAREWVLARAGEHLRAEYRDGFLRGNPVNQGLLI